MVGVKYSVNYCQWMDDTTFVIGFKPIPTTEQFELEGVTEEIVVEYHKDENKWVLDKQWFDADGGFIDHKLDDVTPREHIYFMIKAKAIYNTYFS